MKSIVSTNIGKETNIRTIKRYSSASWPWIGVLDSNTILIVQHFLILSEESYDAKRFLMLTAAYSFMKLQIVKHYIKMTQYKILLVSKTMKLHSGKNLYHSIEFRKVLCVETSNLDISHVCFTRLQIQTEIRSNYKKYLSIESQ